MIFDIEALIDNISSVFKSKLSAEITNVNAERSDFAIDDPKADAWFFQNLREDFYNYEPFVVYGVDPQSRIDDSCVGNAIKTVTMFFEIGLTDQGEKTDEEIFRKLLRYTKALEQVFFKNGRSFAVESKPKLESFMPLTGILDGKRIHVAGIQITASITAT